MRNALRIIGCFLAMSAAGLPPVMAQSPAHRYAFCQGLAGNPRLNNFSRVFAVSGPSYPEAAEFFKHLRQKYHPYLTQEMGCRYFATKAEAENERQKEIEFGRQHPAWPVVEVDCCTGATATAAAAAAPVATASAKPKPAPAEIKPAAPAAQPTASPVAKPAVAASKPGVYVICRSEWNTDLRRFYNPPVDGRGAGYAEWQASYREFLVSKHKFKGTNLGCGKYPTREAAQADYDSWIANARATPLVNGQPSPVTITDWKY